MQKASIVIAFLVLLMTALPFIRTDEWWIRIFDFPRLQIAVLGLLSLVMLFLNLNLRKLYSQVLIILVVIALFYQSTLVMQFTPLYPEEVQVNANPNEKNSFSILHSNVKMDNREAAPLIEMINRISPDILSINEPDAWWEKQLETIENLYPYTIKKSLPNTYGMILYSKFPMKDTEINFLVVEGVPSFYTKVVLPSGKTINMHCVHPEPPRPGSDTYERDTELFIVGKRIGEERGPTIVVGDLNDVAWSRTTKMFKEYSGVLDPRKGRGMYNTFNANWPLLRYPLDHFFFTKEFKLNSLKKLEDIGSDHFPMFIEVSLSEQ